MKTLTDVIVKAKMFATANNLTLNHILIPDDVIAGNDSSFFLSLSFHNQLGKMSNQILSEAMINNMLQSEGSFNTICITLFNDVLEDVLGI